MYFSFGFPEVYTGVIPGHGGTQRFPRIAGIKAALDVIPTGKRFTTKQAVEWGVVDKVSCVSNIEYCIFIFIIWYLHL